MSPCAAFTSSPARFLFHQAVYNIITGTYPCSEEEAVQLAALQFQAKFGKHNPASYVQSLVPFVSLSLIRTLCVCSPVTCRVS